MDSGECCSWAFGCVHFTLSPGSLLCGEGWSEEGTSSTVEAKPSMTVDGLEFEELRSKSAFFFFLDLQLAVLYSLVFSFAWVHKLYTVSPF